MARVGIIGSGFSGLSAACYLAQQGHEVHVFEKNATAGGRARTYQAEGFTFDMGPSWYWMPEVFDQFFRDFGFKTESFYNLTRLDPAFEMYFGPNGSMKIPDSYHNLREAFEEIEPGSGLQLDKFMTEAEYKYRVGMDNLVQMPGLSVTEFLTPEMLKGALRLQIFASFHSHVRKFFQHPKLLALMEFPVLFLGAMPQDTPALYSLMNYAGLKLGTWYPEGGFGSVVKGFTTVAEKLGVQFHFNTEVEKINVVQHQVQSVTLRNGYLPCDGIIASADYHHVEQKLLEPAYRNYTSSYWTKKIFAPSCLIFYIGINKTLPDILHHTLFFEEPFDSHAQEIYRKPAWPSKPLFYVCCPSKTDSTVAPVGHENLFFLMPIATGLPDDEETREKYFELMVTRFSNRTGINITPHVVYKKSYCVHDFISDYHSYQGNAYGLANVLMQTAIFKPKIVNKKIKNLIYAGQLTVPGPGVPPTILSGKIAAQLMDKELKKRRHETTV